MFSFHAIYTKFRVNRMNCVESRRGVPVMIVVAYKLTNNAREKEKITTKCRNLEQFVLRTAAHQGHKFRFENTH